MAHERYTTTLPPFLDDGHKWFIPGLCYVHAKFPASIFQVVGKGLVPQDAVSTLLLNDKLYVPSGFGVPLDNWQRTMQGVVFAHTIRFVAELAAARFRFSDGKVWKVVPQEVAISDPFSPIRVVKALYLLPVTDDHRLIITKIINGRTAVIEKKPNG